jgi:hypothetical protein
MPAKKPKDGTKPTTASPAEQMRALARGAATAAIARLVALSNSEDERVALAATQELLNRAFGKTGAAPGEEPSGAPQQLVVKIVRFGDMSAAPDAARAAGGAA